MWLQFFLENMHFALNLVAALMFFCVFWLYYDAWLGRKNIKEFLRFVGFLFLSISFILGAIYIEASIVADPLIPRDVHLFLLAMTKIVGYLLIITVLLLDPLIPRPQITRTNAFFPINLGVSSVSLLAFFYPILSATAGFLYLRRATIGLENHYKPVALTFFILSFWELLGLGFLLQNSTNPAIYDFVASFGPLWIAQQMVLLISILVIRKWVFGYLLKRFQSQLFIIFTTAIVVIFLITTVVFSALLLKNQQDYSLAHLKTDVNILKFNLESQKAEAVSEAHAISLDPQVIQAVEEADRTGLKSLATEFLLAKKYSSILILSDTGVVIGRGEDPDRVGDSLSDDPIVKRALDGEQIATVTTQDGVIAPSVTIRSATPIEIDGKTRGVVVVGNDIDNSFVDGIKKATSLDASIYADNIRSATTYVASDGVSRSVGIKEETAAVKETVLSQSNEYVGSVSILNTPYLAAYAPVNDITDTTVGMLFVGRPEYELLASAGKSIELTFLVSVVLLIISIVPAYFVSRYISGQIR